MVSRRSEVVLCSGLDHDIIIIIIIMILYCVVGRTGECLSMCLNSLS